MLLSATTCASFDCASLGRKGLGGFPLNIVCRGLTCAVHECCGDMELDLRSADSTEIEMQVAVGCAFLFCLGILLLFAILCSWMQFFCFCLLKIRLLLCILHYAKKIEKCGRPKSTSVALKYRACGNTLKYTCIY